MDAVEYLLETSQAQDLPVIGIIAGNEHFGAILDSPNCTSSWGNGSMDTTLSTTRFGPLPVYWRAHSQLQLLIASMSAPVQE